MNGTRALFGVGGPLRAGLPLAGAALVFAVLLSPVVERDAREVASSVGLIAAGLVALSCGFLRARRSPPAEARPWWLLISAGVVIMAGNAWSAVSGADPVTSPSLFGNLCIAAGLLLTVAALVSFPGTRRRGAELLVMFLDGVVSGGAFLLIAAALIYPQLLDSSVSDQSAANRWLQLAFPALDLLVVTVAALLVLRARHGDRLMLCLVAAAFVQYAAADLAFAVLTAQGTFRFGSLLDLGWILGYLTLGLAAMVPASGASEPLQASTRVSDVLGSAMVFAALALATAIHLLVDDAGQLETVQVALWMAVVAAAGARQVLLAVDNSGLRLGLERRVEEQTTGLRRLARQNEVLITSVGDGVYGVDHEGQITFVNPSAAQMLGWSAEELRGRRAHDVFHATDPDGLPYPWQGCYVHEAIAHGDLATAEEDEYVRADGTRFAVEITASPLLDADEVRGAVVTFRDVTQRREVERMKNEFLSVVSHELRTPLTSIRGSLGLLASRRFGELPDRAGSLVEVALQSSDRLTRLINDLLDIERIESGAKPMEMVALDVRGLLVAAARQIEGMASQADVRVVVGAAEGRVLADEDRVIQTLLNLLGNAIKFSEPGRTVRLEAHAAGLEVHLRVIDQGRGIPADKLEAIFERFEQVDSSDTRQKGGTGLGLAISRGIVEKHGGRIWAESELGEGTTVHVTLPSAMRVTGEHHAGPADPGARSVLVCDDDAAVVDQFCTLLRLHGFRATGVTAGDRAVDLIDRERPDAVVLDLMMPGTTGAEVLRTIRDGQATRDIPVIVISGLGPETDATVADASDDWLVKPVSEARLVNAVSLAVSSRSAKGGSVLLVEDDEGLAEVLVTMLGDVGLDVVHTSSVAEAIARGPELQPDVVVLDLRLPDGSGEDVVAAFGQRFPLAQTPLVVYSAVDVDTLRREQLHLGPTVFLTKGDTAPEILRDQVLSLVRAVTATRPVNV